MLGLWEESIDTICVQTTKNQINTANVGVFGTIQKIFFSKARNYHHSDTLARS